MNACLFEIHPRAFIRIMLAMICRLLATRCCISWSSTSFCLSSSSFSRSKARCPVMSLQAEWSYWLLPQEHFACIQAHRAVSDAGKLMLDLIVFHALGMIFSKSSEALECSIDHRLTRTKRALSSGLTLKTE